MPLRPLPLPFRVGTDICHIPRIRRLLRPDHPTGPASKHISNVNSRFLRRMFTDIELNYLFYAKIPNLKDLDEIAQFVAGRWAAKEAVIKVAPPGRRIFMRDIIVWHSKATGLGAAILDEGSADAIEKLILKERSLYSSEMNHPVAIADALPHLEGQMVSISISHDGEYATATAIASFDRVDGNKVEPGI